MRATFVAVALLAALAVIWCGQTIRKAERSSGNDLVGYLAASKALYAQQDPYHLPDRFPYIYPLFLATVIRPLASLPVRAASVAWFVLQWACLIYVLRAARLRFGRHEVSGAAAIVILVAIFGDVLQIEFLNGQVNLIVLCLVVASVALAEARPSIAPALLGAAIAIKLTPALLLVYWAVRRRFTFVAQAFAWAVAFILLPWIVVRGRLWPMYGDYLHNFILARTQSADPHGREIFFSVYGFIGWLTGSAPGRAIVVASALAVVGGLVAWHVRRAHVRRATCGRAHVARGLGVPCRDAAVVTDVRGAPPDRGAAAGIDQRGGARAVRGSAVDWPFRSPRSLVLPGRADAGDCGMCDGVSPIAGGGAVMRALSLRLVLPLLLVAAVVPYFIDLGGSSIWDANEAYYVETPREMMERGDYVFPMFNYEARLNKPVLSYWMVAGLYKLFGVSVGVQRLGIAIGGMVLIAVAFVLAFTVVRCSLFVDREPGTQNREPANREPRNRERPRSLRP